MDPTKKPTEGNPLSPETPSKEPLPVSTEQLNQPGAQAQVAGEIPTLVKPATGVLKVETQPVKPQAQAPTLEQSLLEGKELYEVDPDTLDPASYLEKVSNMQDQA